MTSKILSLVRSCWCLRKRKAFISEEARLAHQQPLPSAGDTHGEQNRLCCSRSFRIRFSPISFFLLGPKNIPVKAGTDHFAAMTTVVLRVRIVEDEVDPGLWNSGRECLGGSEKRKQVVNCGCYARQSSGETKCYEPMTGIFHLNPVKESRAP